MKPVSNLQELHQDYVPVYRQLTPLEAVLLRLAQVFWWIGCVAFVGMLIGLFAAAVVERDGLGIAAVALIIGGFFFFAARTLSFILGGGFWDYPGGRQ